jgi:NAD(P)-dependent dehydrogenase (short-subunit alcohol dehydrogenase family)
MGTIHGIHAFVPRMLRQGRGGHVVNTASMLGLVASPELAPYTTSKFGVVGLSESLDAELGPKGIRVSAICPGIINTPIVKDATYRGDVAADAGRVQEFYATRGASPDVVADAVLRAIRRNRVIQPVPYSHVMPLWALKRISPRAAVAVSRLTNRIIRR